MKPFIHEDFLLQSKTARMLYHEHAEKLPIIDYHCHLSPREIAEDHRFRSITELWLGGDHYKWRALRANGVEERYITGDASDWEKFQKWAETMPYLMRNPLYHWTHLELKTCFGIEETLNPDSAKRIYDECNRQIGLPEFSARQLMLRYGVEAVCTTDDPIDTLEYHQAIKESGFQVKVLPTWRPDKAMAVADPVAYNKYIDALSEASSVEITSLDALIQALQVRHDYFAQHGCTLADHGLSAFPFRIEEKRRLSALYNEVLYGNTLEVEEVEALQTYILLELARMNAEKGWVQQIHYGPLRNTNTRMFQQLGADSGFDTIGDFHCAHNIIAFMNQLDQQHQLAKTIIYNINPAENDILAAAIGNFQDGSVAGKIQFGSGWWFNDQLAGMQRQMNALSEQGLLSRFVGMLTDSRSFLSYPRHEYFRRILCNLIAADVDAGILPECEMPRICQMVEDISYYNAQRYFAF